MAEYLEIDLPAIIISYYERKSFYSFNVKTFISLPATSLIT